MDIVVPTYKLPILMITNVRVKGVLIQYHQV